MSATELCLHYPDVIVIAVTSGEASMSPLEMVQGNRVLKLMVPEPELEHVAMELARELDGFEPLVLVVIHLPFSVGDLRGTKFALEMFEFVEKKLVKHELFPRENIFLVLQKSLMERWGDDPFMLEWRARTGIERNQAVPLARNKYIEAALRAVGGGRD